MFETNVLNPERAEDRMITVFLNRDCPRTCYQCGIADNSRRSMPGDDWIKAMENLRTVFNPTFILFLGVEPLLLRDDMVRIVEWLRDNDMQAGWYTTSPEPLFTQYRQKLVDAGVNNWSSGIDTLPHLDKLDPETDKKAAESIIALQWMAARGVDTHITTTIHKKNLHLVPEILEWCWENIPNVECAVNFIEWRKEPGFDFFSPPEDMADMLWDGSLEERADIRAVMDMVFTLSRKPNRRFHTSEEYLKHAHEFYLRLNLHCQGAIGPSVDADGTMRLCGYHTGKEVKEYNVLNIDLTPELFKKDWETDLANCPGCYWACFKLPDAQMTPYDHPLNKRPIILPTTPEGTQ